MHSEKKGEESILLMSESRISRSLGRMAYQIAEDHRDQAPLLIIGLKQRGYAIAKQLADRLSSLSKSSVNCIRLSMENENSGRFASPTAKENSKDFDYVVLVDDVIFSGRTMLTAIQETLQRFEPSTLRTAVLVDRGHRTRPVEATFSGLELPTKLKEHVRVIVEEDAVKEVLLSKTDH